MLYGVNKDTCLVVQIGGVNLPRQTPPIHTPSESSNAARCLRIALQLLKMTPYSPRRPVHQPPRPVRNILLFLIAYRLVNAFAVRTFFQPDEYFQSLEPAWEIAFGKDQGAWITWVSERDRVARWDLTSITRNGDTNYDPPYTPSSLRPSTKLHISLRHSLGPLLRRAPSSSLPFPKPHKL